eukprot:scaffold21175_cov55-Phaeocystis_antarctica.AAC.3
MANTHHSPHYHATTKNEKWSRHTARHLSEGSNHFLPISKEAIMMAQLGAILARRGTVPASSARGPSSRAMRAIIAAVERPPPTAPPPAGAATPAAPATLCSSGPLTTPLTTPATCATPATCMRVLTTSSGMVSSVAAAPASPPAMNEFESETCCGCWCGGGGCDWTRCSLSRSYPSQYRHEKGTSRISVGPRPLKSAESPSRLTSAVAPPTMPSWASARSACMRVRMSSSGAVAVLASSLAPAAASTGATSSLPRLPSAAMAVRMCS